MSNTSDQTTQQNKKARLIIDEVGVDTETGIIGRGHSYDNGKTFTVDKTIYGRIFHKSDHDQIWKGIQDKVKTVVEPAKSAADSAVSAADAAVASAQVTSDAVTAIASATAEAKQGANDAMSKALSAWDVASGAKEAVTDFDPLLKSAQSDASKALVQIADTASALSDAKTSFSSGVAETKNLASKAQTTADNAVKSATSVASDLMTVASQAKSNASGITKVTSDVGLLQTTVADNSGNISKVQEAASKIQQAVSDNAGNITTATQTANSAVVVASDARSNATVAIQTASQASITASNASGQAASAVVTANGAMTTASNAKSDATVAVQTASGASLTAINANSDATVAKQTASEAKVQASNAESDFAQLSIRAGKIEASVANNSGAIASVQQTANGLTTTVADIKANGGGVNLVENTDQDFVVDDTANTGTQGWCFHIFSLTQQLKVGDQITVSAEGTLSGRGDLSTYDAILYDPNTTFARSNSKRLIAGKRSSVTLEVNNLNGTGDTVLLIYAGNIADTEGKKNVVHHLMVEKGTVAHDWSPAPEDLQNQFTQTKQSIDGITTIISDPKTGLNATYQTAAGNSTMISNVKGDVTQLQTTANGLTSRVGSLESKTDKQQTAIEQNKAAIALKADQTTVDTLKGTVNQNTATLNTQASQIQAKVSASDVSGMLAGYATQSYAQSLVTQTADKWNLNLTKLQTDVNAIKTTGGGVNLVANTSTDIVIDATNNGANNYTFATIFLDKQPKQGDLITISAEGALTGTGTLDEYQVVLYDWNTTKPRSQSKFLKAGQRDSVTLSLDNLDGSGDTVLLIYAGNAGETAGKKNVVHHLMVEEGTVAHTWSPAPSDMATVTSVTNLSATVDGIKSTVATKADQSTVTQLSNLIQTKVSSDDFNNLSKTVELQTLDSADINTMKTNGHYFVHNLANTPIQGWVYVDVVGNGNDRIRQDVYQDSYTQHCYRRWWGNSWTDWSKSATESEITQLSDAINLRVAKGDVISQINEEAGGNTLIQVSNGKGSLILNADNTIITGKTWIPDAAISSISADKVTIGSSSLYNSDGTLNLVNSKDGTTSKITVTQGNVDFDGTNKNASVIHFASDNNTNAFTITPVGATVTPTLFFERFDQTPGHWLGFTRNETEHEGVMFHTWDDDGERFFVDCHARFNKNLRTIGTLSQGSWDGTTAKPEAGILTIKSGNTIWSGSDFLAVGSNVTGTYTGVWAKAFVQQSTLSAKTNVETVDPKYALDLVNKTDIRSYQYKSDVAQGYNKRYTSLIIDDVNDVSKYYAPDEFINEERTGRDDGSAVGYLFLAVKELTRRIKNLEEKLNG